MSENILIVGAGISGLLAAKLIKNAGLPVTILEKSRGVGGRMATRRFKDGKFDHGAQFFTVRDPIFQQWVDQWIEEKIVQEWTHQIPTNGKSDRRPGHPRYIGTDGMTTITKHLAKDLNIHLNSRVVSITNKGQFWTIETENDKRYTATHLMLTSPVPQSLTLLAAGSTPLPNDIYDQLQKVQYHPCIAALLLLDGPSGLPEPGGMKLENQPIQWIADNHQKGISPLRSALTVHASPKFSQEYFDLSKEQLAKIMIDTINPWLSGKILDFQIHKWRFSQPIQPTDQLFVKINQNPYLYFAGDAFGGARIEGAALSGIAAGTDVAKMLTKKSS